MRTIPIKITKLIKRESNINTVGIAKCFMHFAILLYLMSMTKDFKYSFENLILLYYFIICFVFVLTVRSFMKNILNEDKIISDYLVNVKTKNIRQLSEYYDIVRISKDGEIVFKNGLYCRVVKLDRRSKIGKPKDIIDIHERCQQEFYKIILEKDIIIRKFNLPITSSGTRNIRNYILNSNNFKNENLKNVIRDIGKFIQELIKSVNSYSLEYIMLYGYAKQDLLETTERAIKKLNGSLYSPKICDNEDIYKFFKDFYGIETLSFLRYNIFALKENYKERIQVLVRKKPEVNLYSVVDIKKEEELNKIRNLFKGEL